MANSEKKLEFWSVSTSEMLQKLQTSSAGLKDSEVNERLKKYGSNVLKPKRRFSTFKILLSQFKSPITIILLFAAGLSFFLGDATDTIIIASIILISSLLGFWQEKGAADAFEKLLSAVRVKSTVSGMVTKKKSLLRKSAWRCSNPPCRRHDSCRQPDSGIKRTFC